MFLSSTTWTVAPASVAVPLTLVRLEVVALMLMRYVAADVNTRLPLMLRVPTDVPGINVPPATRTPGAVPVPASVALGPTNTPLDGEISPVSESVPPATTVAPV
jgi:hypothetical protein